MGKIYNLSNFNKDNDTIIFNSERCIYNKGILVYNNEILKNKAINYIGRCREIEFDFDFSFRLNGKCFIDIKDNSSMLRMCFDINYIDFIIRNPDYVKLASKVAKLIGDRIQRDHYYFRLDISKDYSEYYNMILENYQEASEEEISLIHKSLNNWKHSTDFKIYKTKQLVVTKTEFMPVGFRTIDFNYSYNLVNTIEYIQASLAKSTKSLQEFINYAEFQWLKNA